MTPTANDLYGALYAMGSGMGDINEIKPEVFEKLYEFGMLVFSVEGPRLTEYGEHCFGNMEAGGEEKSEIDVLAEKELRRDFPEYVED